MINFDPGFLAKDKDQLKFPTPEFVDPLEQPAMMSKLASKSLINGIASAKPRLVAVGVKGHIVFSDDMGGTWTQADVPVSTDLTAVSFPSRKMGWAVGHDGVVLHTTDGGETWIKQLDGYDVCRIMYAYYTENPIAGTGFEAEKLRSDISLMIEVGPVNPFLDVWFENQDKGFVIGAFNLILRTEDGGKSWVPWFDRTENPIGYHLYSIRPIGNDLFITGESGLVMRLDPQEQRFRALKTSYNGSFFGIVGTPDAMMVFGMRGNVYRSIDGGDTWQKIDAGIESTVLGGALGSRGEIALVTLGSNVYVSSDDGLSFREVKRDSGIANPFHAVTFYNDHTLGIATMQGIVMQKIN